MENRDILPRLKPWASILFLRVVEARAFRMEAAPLSGVEVPASATTFDRHCLCSRTYMVAGTLSLLSGQLFQPIDEVFLAGVGFRNSSHP
jgi:hypothetical protein